MKKEKGKVKSEKGTAKPTITLDDVHEDVATWENQKAKTRKPKCEACGDAVTEFGNDILDSNPRVAYAYVGCTQMQFKFSTPEDAKKADALIDFVIEFMEKMVLRAQQGVKVLDKDRDVWPSGKRPSNNPQIVNPIRKGGVK